MVNYNRLGNERIPAPEAGMAARTHRRTNLWLPATLDETYMQPDLANKIHRLPERRRQLIFRIRRQLAEGTYETPRKLELAVERMLERHFPAADNDQRPPSPLRL